MRLSKRQREQHKGVAQDLILRIEDRLQPFAQKQRTSTNPERISEKINICKERLRRSPKDKDLLDINLELADMFYLTNNATKGAPRSKPVRENAPC